MDDAAAPQTASIIIAVYCGPGGSVAIPVRHGAPAQSVYESVVDALRPQLARRLGYPATPADVVLWRVRGTDALDALQAGASAGASLGPGVVKLKPWASIAVDTLAPGDAIWAELVSCGTGALLGAAGCMRPAAAARRQARGDGAPSIALQQSVPLRATTVASPQLSPAPPRAPGPQLSSSALPLLPPAHTSRCTAASHPGLQQQRPHAHAPPPTRPRSAASVTVPPVCRHARCARSDGHGGWGQRRCVLLGDCGVWWCVRGWPGTTASCSASSSDAVRTRSTSEVLR